MLFYISCFQSLKKHNLAPYQFWEYYFKNGIEETGFKWVESKVDWAEALTYDDFSNEIKSWSSKTWDIVLKDLKTIRQKEKNIIFLSYFFPKQINLDILIEIKRMGIPFVNFYCDNVRDFKYIPKEFNAFDLNWVPEIDALKMYKNKKLNFLHLPMPMWVDYKYRNLPNLENNNFVFIGSKDNTREELLNNIISKGIDIKIYGGNWNNNTINEVEIFQKKNLKSRLLHFNKQISHNGISSFLWKFIYPKYQNINLGNLQKHIYGNLDFETYNDTLKQSQIVLGINRVPINKFKFQNYPVYSRLRDIEAPMLGACYLTEFTNDLAHFYEIGKEIEVYRDENELIEKVKILKSDGEKRKKIRLLGQKKAINKLASNHSIHAIVQYFKSNFK